MRCPVCRSKVEGATADFVANHLVAAHGMERFRAGRIAQRLGCWADYEVIEVCSNLGEVGGNNRTAGWH